MSSAAATENLRSLKTKKALYDALLALLKKNSFKKMTIKNICTQALISRAAFYAHFIDKYDLLEYFIARLLPVEFIHGSDYAQIEKDFNLLIHENMIVLENLVCDADMETLNVLSGYVLSVMNLNGIDKQTLKNSAKNIVLSNFYIGGIIFYLYWQVKNKFPADVPPMNEYFYEIINILKNRQASD